ncbi:phage holin family protein [Bacillus sp. FJAT-53060]|uniref:phage holin family protein n=1 Tax=Bacillus TaxID=1386 RepID=UPI001CFBDEB1|nr:phage holin family protein [Bacillus stratosphericus]
MLRWIASILVNALLLIVIAGYFDSGILPGLGSVYVEGFEAAIVASIILSLLNILVKPFLIILTLPVTVISLGLFLFVINAITLMMTSSFMGDSFNIVGFGTAIWMAIILSVFHLLIQKGIVEPLAKKS